MLLEHKPLVIEVVRDASGVVLSLAGELDAATAADLVAEGEQAVLAGHLDLAVDCARLKFCDFYGLRAMVVLSDRCTPDGSFAIRRPSPSLRRLLAATGLDSRFGLIEPESHPC